MIISHIRPIFTLFSGSTVVGQRHRNIKTNEDETADMLKSQETTRGGSNLENLRPVICYSPITSNKSGLMSTIKH